MFRIYILLFLLLCVESSAQIINKINITGNDRVSSDTIKMFADISVSDDVNDNEINYILKRLYESNFFETIEVNLNGTVTPYTFTDGSDASFTVVVPDGSSALVFGFKNGSYDEEVTFQITSPEGVVTEGGPSPSGGPIKLGVDFCAL